MNSESNIKFCGVDWAADTPVSDSAQSTPPDHKRNRKKWLLLLLVALLLLGIVFVGNSGSVTSSGDRTFVKDWCGAVGTVVGNVLIENRDTGAVYWDAPVPATNKIVVSNLPHGCFLRITWTDWRGPQKEIVEVQCVDDTCYLQNYIPPPPPPPSKPERVT
jgi:hypothetical protein